MDQILSWVLFLGFYGLLEWFFRMRSNTRRDIFKTGRWGSKTVGVIGALVAAGVFVIVQRFGNSLLASAYTFAVLIFVIRLLSEFNPQRVWKKENK